MLLMLLVAMTMGSHNVLSQSVTKTLMPGWNWISCPMMDTLEFETAMGSFTPVSGDVIKSQWGQSIYSSNGWIGTISQFYPGDGFMYKSNRTMPVMVTFNAQPSTPQIIVTTTEPTEITANSAVSGGSITSNDGNYVFVLEKGICWATHPNPMVMNDSFTQNGNGPESFTAEMTDLTPNTVYYVRAYAVIQNGTTYGNELSFTTLDNGGNYHEYVDLGLPSGTLWATCNIGANLPEEYGDYYAWGETQPKDCYDWSTYRYCSGYESTLTKYCTNSSCGYCGLVDGLTTLLPEDDAATVNWGDGWRTPTQEEWQELYNNTTCIWTNQNGINGKLFTSANGNSIFLPTSGYLIGTNLFSSDGGHYWSSSLYIDTPTMAWEFDFYSFVIHISDFNRYSGQPIRAVRSSTPSNVPIGAINGLFSVDENSQVYFSQGNLQYIGSASTPYWKFADHQWDYLGTATGQNSDNEAVDRDLFGWGTSGWNNSNTYYHPWDTDNSDGSLYGPIGAIELTGRYSNADWGVYNCISNGGNQLKRWRTLSANEWNFVLFSRSTVSGIRYAKAVVSNVAGVILLPDDWDANYYSLYYTNNEDANFSSNIIFEEQWNILEQHGAVFLPTAGRRIGTSVNYDGSQGYYWSNRSGDSSYAIGMYVTDSHLSSSLWSNRYSGRSVRLVHNYQP